MAPGLLLQSLFLLQLLCLAVVVCFGAFDAAVGAAALFDSVHLTGYFVSSDT